MASFLRKIFGLHKKKKGVSRRDSITGRNQSFPVPYLSRLEGNALQPGQSLLVRGNIIGKEEFIINFTSGARVELDDEVDALDNRLLSIRVDVVAKRVYLNACIDGEWGKEGTVKHSWKEGDDFDIRIRCHDDSFDIYVNYKLAAKFAHYRPLTSVSHLYINGDVQLNSVSWEGKYYQLPYVADIPDNLYPGRKLHVSGIFSETENKSKPKSFTVDLHAGSDVALHFEPKVIRRACLEGRWTDDEISSDCAFPFKKDSSRLFDVVIYCSQDHFTIYVNDMMLGTFKHVVDPRKIEKLVVNGDMILHGVHLK